MSDFLRHLVGRELGLEPGLRPRLPSLFETGLQGPPMADTRVEREAGNAATHSVAPLPTLAHGEAGPLPARAPVLQKALPLRAATHAEMAAPPPPRLDPALAASAPGDRPASPSTSRATREPSANAQTVRVSTSVEPAPVPPLRVRLAPTQASRESVAALPARIRDATDAPHPATMPTRSKDIAAQATHSRPPSTQAPVQHADPAPTVVQVTIGRIEVRAAPAASSQPRQRDGPRPTALEDYLRDRNGWRER
jgi:hypothetical protein